MYSFHITYVFIIYNNYLWCRCRSYWT